jgi:hypothetical protein
VRADSNGYVIDLNNQSLVTMHGPLVRLPIMALDISPRKTRSESLQRRSHLYAYADRKWRLEKALEEARSSDR